MLGWLVLVAGVALVAVGVGQLAGVLPRALRGRQSPDDLSAQAPAVVAVGAGVVLSQVGRLVDDALLRGVLTWGGVLLTLVGLLVALSWWRRSRSA